MLSIPSPPGCKLLVVVDLLELVDWPEVPEVVDWQEEAKEMEVEEVMNCQLADSSCSMLHVITPVVLESTELFLYLRE